VRETRTAGGCIWSFTPRDWTTISVPKKRAPKDAAQQFFSALITRSGCFIDEVQTSDSIVEIAYKLLIFFVGV
jgi:hypothetical protein